MARPKSLTPTPGEIEIMSVLWKKGILTVREVHAEMVKHRNVAHTTVASMMQLMHNKGQLGLVNRTRPFRYEAVLTQEGAKNALLEDVKTRMFGGSARDMVLHFLSGKVSKDKLAQVEKTLQGLG